MSFSRVSIAWNSDSYGLPKGSRLIAHEEGLIPSYWVFLYPQDRPTYLSILVATCPVGAVDKATATKDWLDTSPRDKSVPKKAQ